MSCYFTSLFDLSIYRTPILHTYTLCILRAYCTSTHYSYYGKILWLVPVKPGSTVTPLLFFSFFLRFFLSSVIACHLPLVLLAGIIYISVHYSSALFLHRLFLFSRSLRIICHPADIQLSAASLHLLTAGLHALSLRIWEAFFFTTAWKQLKGFEYVYSSSFSMVGGPAGSSGGCEFRTRQSG